MAKIKLKGADSGSAVYTLTTGTGSTDRTINLPDSTGTILDENSSLPAANLTGTVATARLGSGTASSGTILYGDQTYKTAPTSFNPDAAQVFNESGADVDFRVESDSLTHALFVQGSDGKVGIGTTSIDERLHVEGGDHERIQIESTIAGDAVIIHKNTANTWKVGATASIGGYGGDGKYSIADGNDIRFAISPTNGEITNPSGIYKSSPTTATATGWNFDTSGAVITCVQNAAIKLGNCGASGFLLINDTTLNGQMAGLFTGGGRFDFVGYSGSWVNSSSPSTSQVGFYRDGSQIYVKNGQAGTVQLGLMTFRTRSGQ
ncbi:hypothetical protein OAD60_04560 [Candidatus Thioglobus sp.]|nr:hypothetical protein [Candidatus Thioglobus sp.]